MSAAANMSDRKLLLILGGSIVTILVGIALFVPKASQEDPQPTTYNATSAGTKAAFLMLQGLGVKVDRWERAPGDLKQVDAERTTLVVTQPVLEQSDEPAIAAGLKQFMDRGGHVLLADGPGSLLPEGESAQPSLFLRGLCTTTPEGPDSLAAAGNVEIGEVRRWSAAGPLFRVSQRCGQDAVVVHYPVGKGEAVWWSSSSPMSNAGLKKDSNLKLLLASLGDGRDVLFDEYLHTDHRTSSTFQGLPMKWLVLQLVLVFVLLVLSFSRRKGPLRMPVVLPRSSPVEFAESMGDLYRKAGATGAATSAAQRRLVRMLQREAGVAKATIDHGPDEVAQVLTLRLGGDWTRLAEYLHKAREVAHEETAPRSALALVRAMAEDEEQVRAALRPGAARVSVG